MPHSHSSKKPEVHSKNPSEALSAEHAKSFKQMLSTMSPHDQRLLRHEITIAVRKAKGLEAPIFFKDTKSINTELMKATLERWKKRKGHTVKSIDTLGKSISSVDIAKKLVKGTLMAGIEKMKPTHQERLTVERIIDYRYNKIPNTSILVRPGTEFLFMKLANEAGDKRAIKLMKAIANRTVAIQKLSLNKALQKDLQSDVFANIPQKLHSFATLFEIDMENKADFAKRMQDQINERMKDVQKLKELNGVPNKETHLRNLKTQAREMAIELARFKMNHL